MANDDLGVLPALFTHGEAIDAGLSSAASTPCETTDSSK
jgi:hypothetical protein